MRGVEVVRSSHDRDRRRRVGCRQGGAPVRAPRGVDARHPRACRPRVDAVDDDAGDRPGDGAADRHRAVPRGGRGAAAHDGDGRRGRAGRPGRARRRRVSGRPGADRQRARRGADRRRPPRPRRREVARARLGEQLRRCSTRRAPCSSCRRRTRTEAPPSGRVARPPLHWPDGHCPPRVDDERPRRARLPHPPGVGVGRQGRRGLRRDDERAGGAARGARRTASRSRR